MFYGLTAIVMVLAAIVLIQSMRAEKRARQHKLDAIRKQIEENEKKKFIQSLEKNNNKTNSEFEETTNEKSTINTSGET